LGRDGAQRPSRPKVTPTLSPTRGAKSRYGIHRRTDCAAAVTTASSPSTKVSPSHRQAPALSISR